MSDFSIQPMNREAALAILYWQYSGEYAIYNLSTEHAEAEIRFFVDPDNHYYAIHTLADGLIGFCCFGHDAQVPGGDYSRDYGDNYGGDHEVEVLDIGLGMRPDLTGQGKGNAFLRAILLFAQQTFAPQLFRATIASFNARSQRLFARHGFQEKARFMSGHTQPHEFVIVTRPA